MFYVLCYKITPKLDWRAGKERENETVTFRSIFGRMIQPYRWIPVRNVAVFIEYETTRNWRHFQFSVFVVGWKCRSPAPLSQNEQNENPSFNTNTTFLFRYGDKTHGVTLKHTLYRIFGVCVCVCFGSSSLNACATRVPHQFDTRKWERIKKQ